MAAPLFRRRDHAGPRRHRCRWPLSLLTLSLAAPAAQAAAYLPGAEPDPPTGDLPPATASATEPLQRNGSGIDWRFGPVRWSGTIAVDARWLKLENSGTSRQAGLQTDIAGVTYLWQPWFVQLRFGAGFFASHDLSDSGSLGTGEAVASKGTAVTGDVGISVFPASRFPFEARASVSDSRTSGESLGSEQRTHRISLSQAYRPVNGNDNYQINVDASHVFAEDGRDSLVVIDGSALLQRGAHRYELSANHADNHRGDGSDSSLLTTLTARHGYHAGRGLDIDSLASWNRNRMRSALIGGDELDTELRQLSTLATWRPRNGDLPFAVPTSTQIVGSARWVEQQVGGNDNAITANSFSATLGASAELGTDWRIAGSGSYNQFDIGGDSATLRSVSLGASLGYSPRALAFGGGWRWAPTANVGGAITRGNSDNDRNVATLQAGHSLMRDWLFDNQDALSLTVTQNAGVQAESSVEGRSTSRALAHGIGLTWQQASDGRRQHFASLSASDSRGYGDESTHFQLVNLQWSQRTQLTRLSSWSGNLTLQFTRSRSDADPLSNPGAPAQDGSWQRFATATLSYEQQRFWGVPRLRFTALGGLSTQQIDRRRDGDINAPLDRVSRSLEARLDYAIGRLEARLSARAARVDERSVASVIARVQRRF